MNPDTLQKEKYVLLKKIKILSLFLLVAFVIIIVFTVYFLKERGLLKIEVEARSSNPPYLAEVDKIIKPLQYSGIQMFVDKDVYLTLDFDKKVWTLHNVHTFDDKGELILKEGKYGTCGELAEYTEAKIRPIFGNNYDIEFVMASQSGYFLTPRSSHIVLEISRKTNSREVYILDPSFHKYGPLDEFDNYLFIRQLPNLNFMENKTKDVSQSFNSAIPLLIRGDYLVGLTIENMNSGFGGKHFILALTLNKKYNYSGRYLFALRYANGDTEVFENKKLARETLSEQEWSILKQKITELFDREVNSLRQ
ncbi:MAG: hypothetical protein PHT50_06295 [Candidatus Omnitrophica bacterium]|nr:hypothetical protein [Candidatus Omnitrophota bacterium]